MITYFRMKRNEWKVKAQFYGLIGRLMDEQKEILSLLQNLYASLKNIPAEELRNQLIQQVAELAHAQSRKEQENQPKKEEM